MNPDGMSMTLIVVSGAPGTGKSTVAAALVAHFGRPLFALGMTMEALADVLGTGGEDWSDTVGDAAVRSSGPERATNQTHRAKC